MKALKWIGFGIVGIVVLILIVAGILYAMGGSKVSQTVTLADEGLALPSDSASLAWGGHVAQTLGCYDCHGENLEGRVLIDAPPFLVVSSNLTSGQGGVGGRYADADWEHAIRHGVGGDGLGLAPMMPAAAYNKLSDDETAALIAFLKTVPPVDHELPATEFRPLGRIIMGTGGLYLANTHIDQDAAHLATAPPVTAAMDYGRYRAEMCAYCHGQDLHGGPALEPGTPPPSDLYVVTGWTQEQFFAAMRTGKRPSGADIDPNVMPWTSFRHMTDAELEAIYQYLSTLTPVADASASGISD